MIAFDVDGVRFHYRVAGACFIDGHVLLHRADFEDFWSLPGGRVEPLETSQETLARELGEELGIDVEVGELLWIAEHFFQGGERDFHEIGLYYRFFVASDNPILDLAREHRGREDSGVGLIFHWFPITSLDQVQLYPRFLREGLANPPSVPEHVIERNETPLQLRQVRTAQAPSGE
jgi:8-oxo-dGTP pyrophosphatase MutT (NUDIX family)